MSPQRAKMYAWLFVALSVSVYANILLFQPKAQQQTRGTGGGFRDSAAGGGDVKAMRVAATAQQAPASRAAETVSDTVKAIQRELKELDLYPGQIDGKATPLTHAAIVAYEQAQALPLTGEPSQVLLRALIVGPSAMPPSSGMGVAPGSAAERLVRDIRQRLINLGYSAGSGEGRLTLELIAAIRAFEKESGMPQTGRVSAALLINLQRGAATARARAG